MCTESSRFGPRNQAPISIIHSKPGRPTVKSPQKILKVCSKCMSSIHPGFQHICVKTTLKTNAKKLLDHHRVLDNFVGDGIIRRADQTGDSISQLQLPSSSGGHPVNLTVASSQSSQPPSKYIKMDLSHIAQLKSTGNFMSNKQLKAITQVVRKVGVHCPSMDKYYDKRHLMCDNIFECIQVSLDYSN